MAFVTGAVAKAPGHAISYMTLSQSSIWRFRWQTRKTQDKQEREKSTSNTLGWEMPQKMVEKKGERIAILATGREFEKLLGIASIARHTGAKA